MRDDDVKNLSAVRMEHAQECLASAQQLLRSGDYKGSANRSYYAVFHAMRAVLAYDGIDMKRHSGIISEFRRLYIKPGILPEELSVIISEVFDVRTDCDYDDFYVISKEEVLAQAEKAERFLTVIQGFLEQKNDMTRDSAEKYD